VISIRFMNDKMYSYREFNPVRREICLFIILLWIQNHADSLALKLEHIELNGARFFEILFYIWGKRDPRFLIKFDGIDFEIKKIFYIALFQFGLTDKSRRL
jgi:hypothetical protein